MKTSLITLASSLMLIGGSMLYLINTKKSAEPASSSDEGPQRDQNIVNDRFRIL